MAPGRILGIDFGERRVGLAISDELRLTAQPLATLEGRPQTELLRELAKLVESECVERIIVGMPISLSGEKGQAAQRVEEFVEKLRATVGVPVETLDERMTTRIAEKALRETDVRGRRARKVIDRVAAALILESYLSLAQTPGEREAAPNGEEPEQR